MHGIVKMTKSVVRFASLCYLCLTIASWFLMVKIGTSCPNVLPFSDCFFFRRGFVGGCALVDFICFDFDRPFGCKGMPCANHSTGQRRNELWWKISVLLLCWFKNRKDGGKYYKAIHINSCKLHPLNMSEHDRHVCKCKFLVLSRGQIGIPSQVEHLGISFTSSWLVLTHHGAKVKNRG